MNSAETAGQLFALGLFILLPLVVIIINGIALGRHRTNKMCAFAIITAMLTIILFMLAGIGATATHVPEKVLAALSFTGMGICLVSFVLAVIGITQCLLKRRYVRGKWRATIALLFSGTFLTFVTISIVDGIKRGLAWREMLHPTTTGGKPIENAAWNFRITAPRGWDEVSTDAFGAVARAAFQRKSPEMFALVFAEDLPEGSELTLADSMDLLKRTLRETTKGAEFLAEEERKEGPFTVRTMEMRGNELINPKFHVFWVTREGNTMYRIATWGPNSQANLIRDEARKLANGFDLIEHRNKPKSTPKPTVAILPTPAWP